METKAPALALLVEDHRDTREMYALALRAAGFAVLEAEDGEDAIVVGGDHLVDVVVTDIRMPSSVTAVDLCRYFVPLGAAVMAVSGVGPGHEHDAVRAAGCALIATKPLTPDALCAHVGGSSRARRGTTGRQSKW
jgi:two-component system chemotaxis response regulator CheY